MKTSQQMDLTKAFWRWFSLSVLVLMIAAAIPALSSDVFIDEGDGDFNAATPVSTLPISTPKDASADKKPASVGKTPASEEGSPVASDLDSSIGELESPKAGEPSPSDMNFPNDPPPPVVEKPVKKSTTKDKTAKKDKKKTDKKTDKKKSASKKSDKKKKKSTADKKKKSKSSKPSKKKDSVTSTEKSSTRKVASFAGGKYATTSKDCAMESAPGAGDSVGTARATRKLWVEDSGNTSYWKVYGKSGNAAYVSRDCF